MTLEYRSARFEVHQREIVIRVAPYGEIAELGGGYREQYTPGGLVPAESVALKLDLGSTAGPHSGPTIGRAVAWEERPDGLYGTFRVSTTDAGDDALILARDGALGASAGFMPDIERMAASTEGGVTTAYGEIREVTLTGTPAYQSAAVAEVRSRQEATPMSDKTDTGAADDGADKMAALEARASAAESELDEARRKLAAAEATPAPDPDPADPPAIQGTSRGHAYRSIGEIMVDTVAAFRQDNAEARERLGQLIDTRQIVATSRGHDLMLRAFATPGVPGTDDATPNAYVPDMLEILKQGRAVAAGLRAGNLDLYYGTAVQMPQVSQQSLIDYHQPAGNVPSQNVQTTLQSFRKAVLAGGQGISWEAAQWSSPGYAQTVVQDLASSYAEKVELESVVGVDAAGPPANVDGILAGATDIPAGTDDMAGLIAAVGAAWTSVYVATRRQPTAILMSAKAWGWAIGQADSTGRPLVNQEAPQNPVGIGDASAIGTFRGLPVVVSTAIPTNLGVGTDETPVVVTNFRDAWLFESAGAPAQVSLTYPDALTTDVTLFGALATAIRRPDAFAAISAFTAT